MADVGNTFPTNSINDNVDLADEVLVLLWVRRIADFRCDYCGNKENNASKSVIGLKVLLVLLLM